MVLLHNRGGAEVDQVLFRFFVMSIHSGGVRAQIRKFSEITPNFGLFCHPKFCWGHPF